MSKGKFLNQKIASYVFKKGPIPEKMCPIFGLFLIECVTTPS